MIQSKLNTQHHSRIHSLNSQLNIQTLPEDGTVGYFEGLPMLVWIEVSLDQQRVHHTKRQAEHEYPPRGSRYSD